MKRRRFWAAVWVFGAAIGILAGALVTFVALDSGMLGFLLPSVSSQLQAARKRASAINLEEIGLAMVQAESWQGRLPARATFDAHGKPLLSWRVQILPFLEQKGLYDQFRQDEPWDSEHNRELIPRMPRIYLNPSGSHEPGKTTYLAVCGKGLMFEGAERRASKKIKYGGSRTIMVVEADGDRAVIWTKPDDWQADPDHPLAGLGHAHPHGFNVLMADGFVHFISPTIDQQLFWAMLTVVGGEKLPKGR